MSWVALELARMNHELHVYDFDTIETHNLSGQFFSIKDIGKAKTQAVIENTNMFTQNYNVFPYGEYTSESAVKPIMIAAFDSMSARKIMYDRWKSVYADDPKALFISPMMAAERLNIYFVTKDSLSRYEAELFEDSEVGEMECSYKATSHVGALSAAMISCAVVNHITNKYVEECREMPFRASYTAEMYKFEIEYL